jgi:predicted secreted hydrolase
VIRAFIGALIVVSLSACGGSEAPENDRPASTGLRYLNLGGESGFARALAPREFSFPLDHGSHREFRTEWWYFTGNLGAQGGRQFGFELTFFRYAIRPPGAEPTGSDLRANEIYMAHFALTDVAAGRFSARERMARGALGLAGAGGDPLRVWVKDWSASYTSPHSWRLEAQDTGIRLDLTLDEESQIVLQGEAGLDRKGSAPGNASYYYSIPRLRARGIVGTSGESFEVSGTAWLDREWSTSALEPGVEGWDWFALELSNGASLMFYRLRLEGGGTSPFSGGSYLDPDGEVRRLGADDVRIDARGEWTSEATGARYPSGWSVRVLPLRLELRLEPNLQDQELDLSVRYWEGAVEGAGSVGGDNDVSVQGYVELTGY